MQARGGEVKRFRGPYAIPPESSIVCTLPDGGGSIGGGRAAHDPTDSRSGGTAMVNGDTQAI
jgi:hypothetical protein